MTEHRNVVKGVYVAECPTCGNWTGVTADDQNTKLVAKDVAEFVTSGRVVKHLTWQEWETGMGNFKRCSHD